MKNLAGLAIIVTLIFGTIYAVGQQIQRQAANDPQIQMAEDLATRLDAGVKPQDLISPDQPVDAAVSLAPFVIIYGRDGKIAASSATLAGRQPVLPPGIFSNVSKGQEDIFTWQPKPGVRIASVVVEANDYFVVSGRSLREVELREDRTLLIAAAGWSASMAVLVGMALTKRRKAATAR